MDSPGVIAPFSLAVHTYSVYWAQLVLISQYIITSSCLFSYLGLAAVNISLS